VEAIVVLASRANRLLRFKRFKRSRRHGRGHPALLHLVEQIAGQSQNIEFTMKRLREPIEDGGP